MALFARVRDLELEGVVRGAFAGSVLVACLREDGRDLLVKWVTPRAEAELVTPLDPRVVGLAASPDGARVAIAGVAREADGAARPPVELLVATLDPPGGVRLIQPSAGLVPEPDVEEPRLLWSGDGRRLAIGGLLGASADHVLTMVFDLGSVPPRTSVVFGRPMQWQGEDLRVSLGGAHSAWNAERDAETPWDGTLRHRAPDGTAEVSVAADGAVTVTRDGAGPRPLVAAPAAIAWIGPHHLATDDGRALDVSTFERVDVLPRGDRAVLVALAEDGNSGVFTRDGALVWAASR